MNYQDELNRDNTIKIKEILSSLPCYVNEYFTARKSDTTSKTRLSYAYDIRSFFVWLRANIPELAALDTQNIPLETIGFLTARDIEEYIDYLQTDSEVINHSAGIDRKISALSSFFNYLYKNDDIAANPCDKVIKPKIREDKRIIKMTAEEVERFLDAIEHGCSSFSAHQAAYLEKTKERDLAIATLLLGTGIRVSECVGIDISDVDFNNCRIKIIRKGGKIQNIPLGDEVIEALSHYMNLRKHIPADTEALFLSQQNKRLTVKAVQNLITKYADAVGTAYHITPHKLRKTYGTELYSETGDIYLVASALGHENINTTKEHYAQQDEERLQNARNAVQLRKKQ